MATFGFTTADSNLTADILGNINDGASAVGIILDNAVALSTAGAKILSIRNHTVEKASVDKDGVVSALTYTSAQASGSNAINLTTAGARINLNNGSDYLFDNSGVATFNAVTAVPALYVTGGLGLIQAQNNGPLAVTGQSPTGAGAVGVILDNSVTLSTSGDKILSVRNNGTEKVYVDKDGIISVAALYISGGSGYIQSTNGVAVQVTGNSPDGASAVGVILNNTANFTTAGAKITSFQMAGVEKFAVDKGGKISTYNAAATAGLGVSPIVGYGSSLANTTDNITLCTFTPAVASLLEIGGYMNQTAYTSGTVELQLTYTDTHSNSIALALFGQSNASSNASTLSAPGWLQANSISIAPKLGTAVSVLARTTGTATTDFYGWIKQIA